MLLKSIITKTLGLKRHWVKRIAETGNQISIYLEHRKNWRLPCSHCGTLGKVRDHTKEREWQQVRLWNIPVKIYYCPARVQCPTCQGIKVENIPWSQGKSPLTVGLIWRLAAWTKLLPWQTVAEKNCVHWNPVAAAVRQAVDYGLQHRELGTVWCIGVDELSRRKGHVYVTNVYDLDGRRLIWSGEGRSRATLEVFFEEHGKAMQDSVIGVCCAMWQPYIDIIKEHLPQATLIFDKFHIVQHLNQAVDAVRKEEVRELQKSNPDLLKRSRYLYLKNPENLTDHQRARLGYLEKLNLKTNRAYLLQETFREFWNYWRKGWAKKFLTKWIWWATHSRLKPRRDFGRMLRRRMDDILNYFELRIDNGMVEGMNNKAKVVSHRCYGFRTAKTYITALYHCLGNLPEPKLVHKFL